MAGVKPDWWIRQMAHTKGMIEPFSERVDGDRIISYGLQPAGYDARLAPELRVFDWARAQGKVLDPLEIHSDFHTEATANPIFTLPPRGYIVGMTMEYFRIP